MYKLFSRQAVLHVTVFIFIITSVISCKKDDMLSTPKITDSGIIDGKDSIVVGEDLLIHPKLTTRAGTTYQWTVNGTAAGNDSVYNFSPDSAGDFTIDFKAINSSGQVSFQYQLHVWNKYERGIILINEGWFGHDNGSINFFRYGRDTIEQMVYHKENPGKDLGVTTQFGAVHNGRLYIVSKQGPFVVTDAKSLKEVGRLDLPAYGRAFLGLDNATGLVSTSEGVYNLNLANVTIGTKVPNVSGETGNMRKEGDHIYVISQSDGAVILKASDYSIVKKIPGMTQGLIKTSDGSLWVAGGDKLFKINTATLDTNSVTLPFSLGDPWFAWNVGTMAASSTENAVFIGKTMPWGAGGNEVFKYIPGNAASLQTPFITLAAGQEFYGAGIAYDNTNNQILVTAVQSGYGDNYSYNHLYFYDAGNASLKKRISYRYFYFPAMMIFN